MLVHRFLTIPYACLCLYRGVCVCVWYVCVYIGMCVYIGVCMSI